MINKLMTGPDKENRLVAIRDANSVKKEDRTDRMEDYLEVIYELVQQKTANNDAEGIEHHLHPETMKKLEEFINELKNTTERI